MRLLKFGAGFILLRWLHSRFLIRWLLRFLVWGGLAYALIRRLKPELLTSMQPPAAPSEPSAWTAPASRVPDSEPATIPSASTPSPESPSTVSKEAEVRELSVEEIPAAESVVADAPLAEIAGDEMVDVIVSASMALDEAPESEASFEPQWVRGDGTPHCPADFPVKAKAQSMIFHNRESRHYEQTVPDVCFASDRDAEAAGYRAPRR